MSEQKLGLKRCRPLQDKLALLCLCIRRLEMYGVLYLLDHFSNSTSGLVAYL